MTSHHDDDRLSVIVRTSSPDRLGFLDEALFSLATQAWPRLEVIVAIQSPSCEHWSAVTELIGRFAWGPKACARALRVDVPAGNDGRSHLVNAGFGQASGRYLAILDDDDVIYTHGYERLIGRLKANTSAALAAGGCRMARVGIVNGRRFITRKYPSGFWAASKFDLFRDNFIPIHAYVLDRARVDPALLRFDVGMPPLEDYAFLMTLATRHAFDLKLLKEHLCEYRVHDGNSIWASDGEENYQATIPPVALRRARRLVEDLRFATTMSMTYEEWEGLVAARSTPAPPQEILRVEVPNRSLYNAAGAMYRTLDRSGPVGRLMYRLLARRNRGRSTSAV